jgi:uncharacterized membrane protein YkvI
VLVKYFRNPILLKVVGTLVALAFLLAIIGHRNMIRFILPVLGIFVLFLFVRRQILNRQRKLTELEKEYLKKRFYEN